MCMILALTFTLIQGPRKCATLTFQNLTLKLKFKLHEKKIELERFNCQIFEFYGDFSIMLAIQEHEKTHISNAHASTHTHGDGDE